MTDIPFGEDIKPPVLLDRSTLEDWKECPFRGSCTEGYVAPDDRPSDMLPVGPAADAGNEVHRIIAEGIDLYARGGEDPTEYWKAEMPKARADLQESTLDGLRKTIYSLSRFVKKLHPHDILLYQQPRKEDGTYVTKDDHAKEHDGQLAWELLPANSKRGPLMVTSEVDLLISTASREEIAEIDFKSGQKVWNSDDVKDAFQFKLHAWLLLQNFPDVRFVRQSVWMTRMNWLTPRIHITRRELENIEALLLMAARGREEVMYGGAVAEAYPSEAKCAWCRAVLICPSACAPQADIAENPLKYAKDTVAVQTMLAKRMDTLRECVNAHGEISGDDVAFGLDAPKKIKKPSKAEYKFYKATP